jgi:hypothetical protein
MKRTYTVALVCLLAGVAWFLFLGPKPDVPPTAESPSQQTSLSKTEPPGLNAPPVASNTPASPAAGNNSSSLNAVLPPSTSLAAKAGVRVVETNAASDMPPEIVLQNVRRAVHQFGEMFGGNPVGTNPEITAALTGKNPKQINFLTDQPGACVNDNGELVDPWGTPYFFHQLSATEMEVHSAGPDKIMWTSDDLVTR